MTYCMPSRNRGSEFSGRVDRSQLDGYFAVDWSFAVGPVGPKPHWAEAPGKSCSAIATGIRCADPAMPTRTRQSKALRQGLLHVLQLSARERIQPA
jgi:hypothetical protein